MRKLLYALLGSVVTLLPLQPARAADEITLGMAVAFSGWMEAYDGEATKMAQLWVEEQNAKGGVLGKKIKVITADTKTDRVEGAKAGKQLVDAGADMLLVSADYDYGAPAALQAQKAGIISVFIGASDPKAGVLGVGPLSFTANNAAQLEGAVMAEWGYEKKGLRKGYMLVDETLEYNKSACAGYEWMLPLKKGELVGQDSFKSQDATISSQVTRLSEAIRTKGVDHVMLCSANPAAASALRQLRAAGIAIPVLSATAMDGTYWVNSVPGLKDFYLPVQALVKDDPRPDVNALTAAFEKKYGKPPTTQYAYPIYAFLQMWAAAAVKTGTTDSKAVVGALNEMGDFPTVIGPRSFSPKLHIQTRNPMFVVSYDGDKETSVGEWTISQAIPDAVLYRLKK
ncbi:branched-chain amino acid transport system substrate-binding protein [Ancylobacter sp. 3268]|uniref:ABC transporter substrate-binding protein n=1 Tax=Ancylobacter sp. 3268 TaxID=2817752 RepID=UPI00285DE265|nr:ABC transporter substrate-binding protein [Ancylobacter sp. 3268]MDR6953329.1 branched-chain amino acid transport system substrate-binding protein [Ancylobacter sp. 3268]